jgi:hypothetical protein
LGVFYPFLSAIRCSVGHSNGNGLRTTIKDYNGFKKGTDLDAFYPFLSAIRCSIGHSNGNGYRNTHRKS